MRSTLYYFIYIAVSIVLIAGPGLAQPTTKMDAYTFDAQVSTLALSDSLWARGNLGGITVDRLGYIYVANFSEAVYRISPEGKVETLATSLYGASGNTIDARGDLFQANFFGHTISKITRTGEVSTYADSSLSGPVGLVFDAQGNLYVCNCSGNFISKITPDQEVSTFARSDMFNCPNGITLGPNGNLYVVNFNNGIIVKITMDGQVSEFATVPNGGNAHIAFASNAFYITKIKTNMVYEVSMTGDVTPLAGTGQLGSDDGPGPTASFYRPNGITTAPGGQALYINTLIGIWNQPVLGGMAVRKIQLASLGNIMEDVIEKEGIEKAIEVYHQYKNDPQYANQNTLSSMIPLGYRLLSSIKMKEAITVFKLNAESYPRQTPALYNLAEAYRYARQTKQAIEYYKKVLQIDPDHQNARQKVEELTN